jgi:hypothetical protein
MDEEIIYKHTKVSYDEDNAVLTDGKHIQVRRGEPLFICMLYFHKYQLLFLIRIFVCVYSMINQVYMEYLQDQDPVLQLPRDFIMVGRVSIMIRGLAHALNQSRSVAKAWKPIAEKVLRDEGIR